MKKNNVLLEVKDLKKWFPVEKGVIFKKTIGNIKAVDGVSFTVNKGETLGLVGESGCGKTTTGRCILQFEKQTAGTINFNGQSVTELAEKDSKLFRRQMQIIFQDPYGSLNPRMKVRDIIGDPLVVHKLVDNKSQLDDKVKYLMNLVGLKPEMAERFPHQFSGGERQRLGIARALALDPSFIVCDEAVSALDVSIQAQIVNLFSDLQEKLGLTYLFISHDLAVVRHISDRIAVMYLGHIVELAPSSDIYSKPMHPYTQALLSAVAIPDPILEKKRKPIILQGEVPSLMVEHKGCVFAERCPMHSKECDEKCPSLEEKDLNHFVACCKI